MACPCVIVWLATRIDGVNDGTVVGITGVASAYLFHARRVNVFKTATKIDDPPVAT